VNKGMSHIHKIVGKNDEWLTPPEIIDDLGPFDLDPCHPENSPWIKCPNYFTKKDDGLSRNWFGRVWLNPPYGLETGKWLKNLLVHGNGIALIYARVETKMFFDYVWNSADALLFIKGRLSFYNVNGKMADNNGGAPSVLIAYGMENSEKLSQSTIAGKFINLKR